MSENYIALSSDKKFRIAVKSVIDKAPLGLFVKGTLSSKNYIWNMDEDTGLILLEASVSGQDPFSWTATGTDNEVVMAFKTKGDRDQLWSFPRTNGKGPIRLKYNDKYVVTAKKTGDEGDIKLELYNGGESQIWYIGDAETFEKD
ncbi:MULTISPECIES: RICIN domain-containing protein [Burkholderia]|nr:MULTISPECIES: hypothetical protein [Burkholderia]